MSKLPVERMVKDANQVLDFRAGGLPLHDVLASDLACHVLALAAEVERLEGKGCPSGDFPNAFRQASDIVEGICDPGMAELAEVVRCGAVEYEKLQAEHAELFEQLDDLAERMERCRAILRDRPDPGNWGMLDTTRARRLMGRIEPGFRTDDEELAERDRDLLARSGAGGLAE